MPGREINSKSESDISLGIVTITSNTTTVGEVIDLQRTNSILFQFLIGDVTDGTYTLLLEESIDLAFTVPIAITDDDLRGKTLAELVFTTADADTVTQFSIVNNKRFLRLSVVSTGVTSGGFFSATAIRQDLSLAPVS